MSNEVKSELVIGKVLPQTSMIDVFDFQVPLLFYPFETEIYNQIPFNASPYLQHLNSNFLLTAKFKTYAYAFLPLKVKLESKINLDYSSKLMEQNIEMWKQFYKETQKNLRILHNVYTFSIEMVSKMICDRVPENIIDVLKNDQNRIAAVLVLLNVILFNSRINIIYLEPKNVTVNDSCLVIDYRTLPTNSVSYSEFQSILNKLQFLNTLGGIFKGKKTYIPTEFLTVLPMEKLKEYEGILDKYISLNQ